jgi:hypothetical protein
MNHRFKCPACGRSIFNRRNPSCEFCSASIPAELLYSVEQLALINADHERNEQIRSRLAKQAQELEQEKIKRRGQGG